MAPKYVKEPPTFGSNCENFSYWKKCMMNYLKLIEVWSSVEKGFKPTFGTNGVTLTTESKLEQTTNDNAINAILNSVSENIAMIFNNSLTAKEMWDALLERYEGNTQIKSTKINGLETRFENFRVDDKESTAEAFRAPGSIYPSLECLRLGA